MNKTRGFRIFVFSTLVVGLLFSNVCTDDFLASPLFDEGLKITKSAEPMEFREVGEEITYTIVVENTSKRCLDDISITDDLIEITCPGLEDGLNDNFEYGCGASDNCSGKTTCTGTHIITEKDIAAGEVVNTATISATYYEPGACCGACDGGTDYYPSVSDSVTVKYDPPPVELSLEKSGSPDYFMEAGEEIKYTYLVTNTSNAEANGPITISDNMVAVACPSGGLLPGENMTCTASYTTTADDVAAGIIRNTATASSGRAESNPDSFEVVLEVSPEISLSKSGTPTNFTNPNEIIVFSFNATNTGNVLLSAPFTLSDPMLDELECKYPEMLMLSASFTCVGYHRIQSSDIGNTMQNCATASVLYSYNTVTSAEACIDIYFEPPREKGPDLPPPPPDDV